MYSNNPILTWEFSFFWFVQNCKINKMNLSPSKHLFSTTILNKENNSFFTRLFLSFNLSKQVSNNAFNFCVLIKFWTNLHIFSSNLIPSKCINMFESSML